jgi:succinate dehydrogenase / fumarate reductase flavoprotein subunit
VSVNIIDQCVAQGVPFAREYGGYLANRSFGGAQVSRTFYARGQTGQQLLLGAYSALMKEVARKNVELYTRREMLDLVVVDGRAVGIVVRNLVTGKLERHAADAVVLLHRRLWQRLLPLHQRQGQQRHRRVARAQEGRLLRQPLLHADSPHLHPRSRRLPVEAHADEREPAQRRPHLGAEEGRRHPLPDQIPEAERNYYLEEKYPSFGNLVPRDVASRNAKYMCDAGLGVGGGEAVYLDFRDAIKRDGEDVIKAKYGNLFDMYQRISDDDPFKVPMKIFPAVHYTMGGLWVDYHLMSNLPGLFVLGEANFSDHGANRLGASALMQGLADGYFVIPYTLGHYPRQRRPRQGRRGPRRVRQVPRPRPPGASTSSSTSRARRPWTSSTANWPRDVGTSAAWAAPPRASRQPSSDPADPRGILEQRQRHRQRPAPSTRCSSAPAASPTSWSSAS